MTTAIRLVTDGSYRVARDRNRGRNIDKAKELAPLLRALGFAEESRAAVVDDDGNRSTSSIWRRR